MATQISNYIPSYAWKDKAHNLFGYGQKKPETDLQSSKVASVMHRIVSEEAALAKVALEDPWRRFPVAVIGGGALTVAELTMEGISIFAHSAAVTDLLIGIGFLAGILTIREGMLAIEEGLNAWKNNDKKLGLRLLLQGTLTSMLGAAMFLLSISRLLAITSIVTFFAAHPYILPALFLVVSLFLLIETVDRLSPIIQGKDLGSKLELPKLRSMLKGNSPEKGMEAATKWVHSKIKECMAAHPAKCERTIQTKLNEYKSEIGFPAAIDTFKLFEMILQKKKKAEILKQIEEIENRLSSWNQALYLKIFSVLLAAGGFSMGMGALAANSKTIEGVQNLAMAASWAVPLYLDVCKPFEREIPIVVHRPEGHRQKTETLQNTKAKSGHEARLVPGSAA